jgi:hypothetical protein
MAAPVFGCFLVIVKLSASPVRIVGFFKSSLLISCHGSFNTHYLCYFLIIGCRREWFLTTADRSDTTGLTKMAAAGVHVFSKCFYRLPQQNHSAYFKRPSLEISCVNCLLYRSLFYIFYF